jgi:esterase/lipase superfamily enzyme
VASPERGDKVIGRWKSERLEREVTLVKWGTIGQPLLLFPTAGGDAEEVERWQMLDVLAPLLDDGLLKVYSCDSVAGKALLAREGSAAHQMWLQNQFHHYVRHEVVPAIRADCKSPELPIWTAGASIGAFHAAAVLCRFPDVFTRALALSGTYDLRRFYDAREFTDHFWVSSGCGPRPGSRCSARRSTPAPRAARSASKRPGSASAPAGSATRWSRSSRRTSPGSGPWSAPTSTRIPWRCSTAGWRRSSRPCACTTARSTGGTGRATASSTASPTCGSRTASCRPDRRRSTRSPTPPCGVASWSSWATGSTTCPGAWTSIRPAPTSTPRPARASAPTSPGSITRTSRPASSCSSGCCRPPRPGCAARASTRATSSATWA